MPAVAVRKPTREETTRLSAGERHARAKRRRRARSRGLVQLACPCVLVGLFLYVGLYASVTANSYAQSRLRTLCRQERITNERLKVELTRRSSPSNVMAAAQKAGMVYATDYEYLRRPPTVASARTGE